MRSSIWFPAAIPCARIACMQSRRSDRSAPASSSTRPRSSSSATPSSRSSTSSRRPRERMLEIARLSTTEAGFDARLKALTSFDEEVERKVVEICENVRNRGDAAVLEYNENPEWGDRVKAVRVAELELK